MKIMGNYGDKIRLLTSLRAINLVEAVQFINFGEIIPHRYETHPHIRLAHRATTLWI